MIPVLFRYGRFELGSFVAMAGLGTALAFWIWHRRLKREGVDTWEIQAMFLAAGVFGVFLSRVWFFYDYPDAFTWRKLLTGADLRWHAFLIGSTITMIVSSRYVRVEPGRLFDAAALAVAPGQAIGRLGCLLVGDACNGIKCALPWAVTLKDRWGDPYAVVHPTPLYESFNLLLIYWIMVRIDRKSPRPWTLTMVYLTLSGLQRFIVQFWRADPPWFGPVTTYHVIALTTMAAGLTGLAFLRHKSA